MLSLNQKATFIIVETTEQHDCFGYVGKNQNKFICTVYDQTVLDAVKELEKYRVASPDDKTTYTLYLEVEV